MYRVAQEYIQYFNRARPHQGIGQKTPEGKSTGGVETSQGKIIPFPVFNGLHHDYRRARCLGLAKTHLQHILIGIGMKLLRVVRWLTGEPVAQIRPSSFVRLHHPVAAGTGFIRQQYHSQL